MKLGNFKDGTFSPVPTDTTDDALLGGRVVIRQPKTGYRVAADPILLAAAARAEPGMRVLDAGSGTGAVMLCLAARVPGLDLTGLELQAGYAALATVSIGLNKLENARVVSGNIVVPPAALAPESFDMIVTNPPYGAEGTLSPHDDLRAAHHEGDVDITRWIASCLGLLKTKGRFVMIHRADRLSEIIAALVAGKAGDIRILPIHSKAGEPARRVIVDAGKGRRSPDTLLAGLVVHNVDGSYTPVMDAVLRDAAPLPMGV